MATPEAGTALITGASAGIGSELAGAFAAGGHDLVVVARRRDRLEELAADLGEAHGVDVHVVTMDLTEAGASADLHDAVAERGVEVDVLANNVGVGAYGPFHETDLERELVQVRLNVELPLHLTKLYLPVMVERDKGAVLNVASLAGFQAGPRMAGYYASKAYLLRLSEAVDVELADTGVSVTALCPGPVETEFQQRADMGRSVVGSTYTLTAEEVATAGYRATVRGDRLVVPGLGNKLLYLASRLFPRRVRQRLATWINADR